MPRARKLPLLRLVAQPGTLDKAWRAVRARSSPQSRGYDNVTLATFARNWVCERRRISQQLREDSYRFFPYLGQPIPKKGNADPYDLKSWRPISIAAVRDRVVQRAILDRIWPDIRKQVYTSTSFGGIRRYSEGSRRAQAKPEDDSRRCVRTAVRRIVELKSEGYSWVFETDIENFFPSINRDRLFGQLHCLLRDTSIDHLIEVALDTSVVNASQLGPLSELWNSEIGVPQGGILSPMLANLYLYEHDQEISRAGFNLIRYVDDLIVLTKSKEDAQAAYQLCNSVLRRLDLKIHPLGQESNNRVKTNIHPPSEPFDFLGLTFASRSIRPTRKKFDSLKKKLLTITECERSRMKLHQVIERVNWCILGWVKAYDFCNLSCAEVARIDSQVGHLVRRWLRYRKIIAKENKLDTKAFLWLGIQRAQDIPLNPIIDRRSR